MFAYFIALVRSLSKSLHICERSAGLGARAASSVSRVSGVEVAALVMAVVLAACQAGTIDAAGPKGDALGPSGDADNSNISLDPQDAMACNACHGSNTNSAPPKDLSGESNTTSRGVGAHQAHLTEGPLRVAVQCNECHLEPANVSSVGHLDSDRPAVAEVVFGELATTGGLGPTWDPTTLRCAGVYCHGASKGGGTNTSPLWTTVDGSQSQCGSCHGLPPPAPHPDDANCASCHGATVNADNVSIKDKTLHINGVVDGAEAGGIGGACNSCHGSATSNAPPVDTRGNSATTERSVGAHQAHLTDGPLHNAFGCTECHNVPATVGSPGHLDVDLPADPADLTFSRLAVTGGVSPSWSGTSCANVYCHGNFAGGLNASPVWTTVNGTQAACGSCHGISPNSGDHRAGRHVNLPCSDCHGTGYSRSTVRLASHVNGVDDVGGPGSKITRWTKPTCTPTCHGSERWPNAN
jgi:predicted CxxxxCH...CXXCH cytochrome family protein